MNPRINIGFVLLLSAAANSAEPPAGATQLPKSMAAPAIATPRVPLKLGIGDIRKYMMPNEFRSAVAMSEADKNAIIVEGDLPAAPLRSTQPLPQGLGAVYSLFRHPASAWRMFVPDPRGVPPGPPDVVPAREFRWGP